MKSECTVSTSVLLLIAALAFSARVNAGIDCGSYPTERERIESCGIIAIAQVTDVTKSKISLRTIKTYKGRLPASFEYLDDPDLTDNDVPLDSFKKDERYLITVHPAALQGNRIRMNYCDKLMTAAEAKSEIDHLDASTSKKRK